MKVSAVKSAAELERKFVHNVYDSIADQFNHNHYKAWPKVKQFLSSLPNNSLVADIGCGNGKYFLVNDRIVIIGVDVAPELALAAKSRSPRSEVCIGSNHMVPFRDNHFDAVLSIAVIHHFYGEERRLRALKELVRILKPDGRLIVYVWALEQPQRQFSAQDVLVPWKRLLSGSQESVDSQDGCERDSARMIDICGTLDRCTRGVDKDLKLFAGGDIAACAVENLDPSLLAQLDIRPTPIGYVRERSLDINRYSPEDFPEEPPKPTGIVARVGQLISTIRPWGKSEPDSEPQPESATVEEESVPVAQEQLSTGNRILGWLSPRFTRKAPAPKSAANCGLATNNCMTDGSSTKPPSLLLSSSSRPEPVELEKPAVSGSAAGLTYFLPSRRDLVSRISRFSPSLARKADAILSSALPQSDEERLECFAEKLSKECIAKALCEKSIIGGEGEEEEELCDAVDQSKSSCKNPANHMQQQQNGGQKSEIDNRDHVDRCSQSEQATTNNNNNNGAMSLDENSAFYRYYHVFQEGELESLMAKVPGVRILSSYYDHSNWCLVAQKEAAAEDGSCPAPALNGIITSDF